MTLPFIIATGDPAGIGPEISVQAAVDVGAPAVLVGDAERLTRRLREVGVEPSEWESGELTGIGVAHAATWSDSLLHDHAPSAAGGRAQLAALDRAIDIVASGVGAALVTAPTSKEAITLSGCAFTGQTEHLAARMGLERDAVTMLFLGPRLRVGLVTTHLSVRDATQAITPKRVRRSVLHLLEAVERMLGRPASLVVSGLNPHAGESGLFGDEELLTITPALEALRLEDPKLGSCVHGPMPAESALRYAAEGRYDCVLAMIHDQATIASKLLDWGQAVNVTWGLPFLRTSVDHGTAYDAAKSGSADPEGMCSALRMAQRLCQKG